MGLGKGYPTPACFHSYNLESVGSAEITERKSALTDSDVLKTAATSGSRTTVRLVPPIKSLCSILKCSPKSPSWGLGTNEDEGSSKNLGTAVNCSMSLRHSESPNAVA